MITRLREQLDHQMKKNLEMKNELRKLKDEQSQRFQHKQIKDALINLEKEFNATVIRNNKLTVENQEFKRNNDELSLELKRARGQLKDAMKDTEEIRKTLANTSGF